jgi:hypothetical protein
MQIDRSDEHFSNAAPQRIETLQGVSNVKFQRLLDEPKQRSGILAIEEGRQTEGREEQYANADSPRVVSLQADSKVKPERRRQ